MLGIRRWTIVAMGLIYCLTLVAAHGVTNGEKVKLSGVIMGVPAIL
jgi:hypothetical protein